MKRTLKGKFSLLVILMVGLTTTQLYQNCAPVMPGFTTMSSETNHDIGDLGRHPLEEGKPLPSQRLLVAPKGYVAALFREIFTSTKYPTNLDTFIEKWVYYKGSSFGGACNIYTSYSTRECGGSASNTDLDVYSDDSTVRESFRIQICENALGLDNGVHAALEKISLTYTSGINAENIAKAHGLFYRNDPPEQVIIDTLLDLNKSLVEANATPINRWRAILGQICESPGWQIL